MNITLEGKTTGPRGSQVTITVTGPAPNALHLRRYLDGALAGTEVGLHPVEKEGTGLARIRHERIRQVEVEGYDAEHDAGHDPREMMEVAVDLAWAALNDGKTGEDLWGLAEKHASNPVRALSIAGALLAATIDRIQQGEEETDGTG